MATIKEVQDRLGLSKMDILDIGNLMAHSGRNLFDKHDNVKLLADFINDASTERYICLMLGLETEEEKMSRAAVESARAARESAHWAMVAAFVATFALAISLYQILSK